MATGQIDFTWSTYQYLTWPGHIDHLPGQAIDQYMSKIYVTNTRYLSQISVTNTRYLSQIEGTNTSHRRPSARPQAGLQQLLLPPENYDHNKENTLILCIFGQNIVPPMESIDITHWSKYSSSHGSSCKLCSTKLLLRQKNPWSKKYNPCF